MIQVTLKYGYFFLITASSSPNDTSVFVSLITSSQFHNIPWSFAFLVVFKQENSQYKFLVFLPTCKIMLSIMLFGISQTSFISYNYIIIFYYSCFLFLNLKKQKIIWHFNLSTHLLVKISGQDTACQLSPVKHNYSNQRQSQFQSKKKYEQLMGLLPHQREGFNNE